MKDNTIICDACDNSTKEITLINPVTNESTKAFLNFATFKMVIMIDNKVVSLADAKKPKPEPEIKIFESDLCINEAPMVYEFIKTITSAIQKEKEVVGENKVREKIIKFCGDLKKELGVKKEDIRRNLN